VSSGTEHREFSESLAAYALGALSELEARGFERHTAVCPECRDELDELRRATRRAIRNAIRRGGAHTGELNPERQAEGRCPRCGTELSRARIGGRTTYWCPEHQPDASGASS